MNPAAPVTKIRIILTKFEVKPMRGVFAGAKARCQGVKPGGPRGSINAAAAERSLFSQRLRSVRLKARHPTPARRKPWLFFKINYL
jgi:hypothetical protein